MRKYYFFQIFNEDARRSLLCTYDIVIKNNNIFLNNFIFHQKKTTLIKNYQFTVNFPEHA